MSEPIAAAQREELARFRDQDVVLDTRGELLFVGRLNHIGSWFLELTEADVHDLVDSRSSKEVYLIEAAKHGIKKNRHAVFVKWSEVVSISLLSDVIKY